MAKVGIKKGFTLVELLVVVAVLAILSGAAYIGIQRAQSRVMNEKVLDDLAAITNALEQYKRDNGNYPNFSDNLTVEADKNINCFNADTSYAHCPAGDFIQTQVDNTLLTKRYLQEVPTDPLTGSRYVYGVTASGNFYQVAGNFLEKDGTWTARVVGNLNQGYALPSLIRAFDGPNFVTDNEGNLPYSPDHLSISARLDDVVGNVRVDGAGASDGDPVAAGQTIETDTGASVVVYLSDGSVTYLDEDTTLRILPNSEVEQNDEDGIITKIRLKLFQGKIWNKVARLASESEFNVETTSAIAGVRGTEFGISEDKDDPNTLQLVVLSGEVASRKKTDAEANQSEPVTFDQSYFNDDQVAEGNGTFIPFVVPLQGDATSSGAALSSSDFDHYYQASFNNNVIPRILKVDTTGINHRVLLYHVEGVDKIRAVYEDDITSENLDFVDDYPDFLTADVEVILYEGPVRFQLVDMNGNASGLSSLALELVPEMALSENQIYNDMFAQEDEEEGNVVLEEVKILAADFPRVVAGTNKQLTATAMYSDNTSADVTMDCDWTTDGNFGDISGSGSYLANIKVDGLDPSVNCNYDGQQWDMQGGGMTVVLEIKAACFGLNLLDNSGTNDDKGYWDVGINSCWLLANVDQTCVQACNVMIGAICRDTSNQANDPPGYGAPGINWDDDNNAICDILVAQSGLNPNVAALKGDGDNVQFSAPYVVNIDGFSTQCWSRDPGANKPTLCEEDPPAGRYRVCSCV